MSRGVHPADETPAQPTSWSCDRLSLRGMKVRSSVGRTARELMLDTPRHRVFAPYGAQKLPTNRIPSQRLPPVAARNRSAGLPPLCDPARRPSRLTLCTGTNINSGAPATGDQRFSHQGFPARPLDDPARLVAPGAVAQQAPVERADRQARQLGREVDRVRTFWRAAGIQLTIGCARRSAYVLLFQSSTSACNL
jgi:hypothetical protein